MDKEKAKEFLYDDDNKIYISKDLQKLIDMSGGKLIFIFAVLDTESGEILMHMDWAYSGEPIIMGRFIHKEYFLTANSSQEIVYI